MNQNSMKIFIVNTTHRKASSVLGHPFVGDYSSLTPTTKQKLRNLRHKIKIPRYGFLVFPPLL